MLHMLERGRHDDGIVAALLASSGASGTIGVNASQFEKVDTNAGK
jgi:hypothetical protein